jgi:hypothetical protein
MTTDFHGDSKLEPLVLHLQMREGRLLEMAYIADVHLPSGMVSRINKAFNPTEGQRERIDSVVQELIESMLEQEGLSLHLGDVHAE